MNRALYPSINQCADEMKVFCSYIIVIVASIIQIHSVVVSGTDCHKPEVARQSLRNTQHINFCMTRESILSMNRPSKVNVYHFLCVLLSLWVLECYVGFDHISS